MSNICTFEGQFSTDQLRAIFTEKIQKSSSVGKDGLSPLAFSKLVDYEIPLIQSKIVKFKYKFTPYKQRLILKGAGKPPREISIASVRDRIVLRAITNILLCRFEDRLVPSPHQFIREISELIAPYGERYSFVQIDVKDFYPSIRHEELMTRIRARVRKPELLYLIGLAITTPTGSSDYTPSTGVPQGLSVSNILSSIYMTNFDKHIRSKYSYFRYVDDIVVVCRTDSAERAFSLISGELRKIGLSCHELGPKSKSKIVPVTQGIDYLGYHLRPNKISVRSSSLRRMMDNIISVISSVRYIKNHRKILTRLNIKITGCIYEQRRMGWMFFFSMTEDLAQLKRLDKYVKDAWIKFGLAKYGEPKKFVKSYYEIRYNLHATKYIPKFDDYTKDQKAKLISALSAKKLNDILNWDDEKIDSRFSSIVRHEIRELEKDLTPVS